MIIIITIIIINKMQIKLFYIMGEYEETNSFREKQFSIHKFAYLFTLTEGIR